MTATEFLLQTGPKKRPLHHSYEEDVNEPGALVENEPFDIEGENPGEENEAVEGNGREEKTPPAFDEEK